MSQPLHHEDLGRRIRAEYRESPGLKLTKRQAQRLWGIDCETCDRLLAQMVATRFLRRRADGTYVRVEYDR